MWKRAKSVLEAPFSPASQRNVMHQIEAMADNQLQAKILAFALYEIRLLLAGYLGSSNEGEPAVRAAAHLAYALHNQALATLDGKPFDEKLALEGIKTVDDMFGENFTEQLSKFIGASDA